MEKAYKSNAYGSFASVYDMFMEQIMEQMPVVLHSLNIGFIQTLKLFFVTLIGAFPLGLLMSIGSTSRIKPLSWFIKFVIWIIRGTPLMIQLLIIYYFPGLVLHNPIWGGGESGRFLAASFSFILNYSCYFSEIYRRQDRRKQAWFLA